MAVPKFIIEAKGMWKGSSQLNLPWLPPEKQVATSGSSLHIDCDHQHTFATITYTWSEDGKEQEGTMLLSGSEKHKTAEIGWVDSWHQNTAVMHLAGDAVTADSLKTKGTYTAEGQTWGWTIALRVADGKLHVDMENVVPDHGPMWAVRGIYSRE